MGLLIIYFPPALGCPNHYYFFTCVWVLRAVEVYSTSLPTRKRNKVALIIFVNSSLFHIQLTIFLHTFEHDALINHARRVMVFSTLNYFWHKNSEQFKNVV